MKAVQINQIGKAEDSISCIDVEEPAAPAANEVTYDITAFPINPADLLFIEGGYSELPKPPGAMGAESVGQVTAVGSEVSGLKPGDTVMHMGRENWTQAKTVPRTALIKMPEGIDPLQLAMLKVNPPTALLMLSAYVDLQPGEWVIQSAANSAVGHCVIRMAKARGLKTVNIVRRDDVRDSLLAQGADVVIVDSPTLAADVAQATSGANIRLGIDAVAGELVNRMADAMSEGGTIVNYGMLSGENCAISPNTMVFKDISLRGFWLMLHLQRMSVAEMEALYVDLADQIRSGALHSEVEAVYEIDDIQKAVAHAQRGGRQGKILVRPNDPL